MHKDYAKQNLSKSAPWRWDIVLVIVIIVCILGAVLFALGKKSYYKLYQSQHFSMKQVTLTSDVHFDFYAELPNMKTIPIIQPVRQYIVQIGKFDHSAEASQTRISLLLAGVDVELVKVKIGNKSVYQLQQGPYATKAMALDMQQALQQKGIASVVALVNDSKRPHIN